MIAKPAAMPGICGARKASPPASSVNTSRGHSRLSRIALGCCSGSEVLACAVASSRAIGGLVAARRPSRIPTTVATSHQPAETNTSVWSALDAPASTVTTASAVAAAALSSTVVLRKSTKRTPLQERLEQPPHAPRPVHRQVRLGGELGRGLVRGHGDAESRLELPFLGEPAQGSERIEVGGVVPDVDGRGDVLVAKQRGHAEPLVEGDGRAHLQHLAPPVDREALAFGLLGDLAHGALRRLLVRRPAPVKCRDRILVLAA